MVCLPCCVYPLLAFLLALYYRYLHPLLQPLVSKLWTKTPAPAEETHESQKRLSDDGSTAAATASSSPDKKYE